MHRTLASLVHRNIRLHLLGETVSVSGNWMQAVGQGFLVLDLTGSGTQLGLTTAARFLPMFLLGPWGGLVADRLPKRTILVVAQTAGCLVSLLFATLVATDVITLWAVYVLAAAFGTANAFAVPARQAIIAELVPHEHLGNAVTLNVITSSFARTLGASLGGAAAALVGLVACFYLNSAMFLLGLLTVALMDRSRMRVSAPEPRERGQIRSGFRYVRQTPELLVPLLMIAVVGTLAWEFQVSLPLLARETFGGGPATFGALAAAMSAGSVIGGLISASRPNPRTSFLAVAAVAWGATITVAAVAPTLAFACVAMFFVGYGGIAFNAMGRAVLQLAARPAMRGRVMAIWMVAWGGTTPIGGPIVGWIGETVGARVSLLAGGVPTILVGLVGYPLLRSIDARRRRAAEQPSGDDPAASPLVPVDGTTGDR